MTIELIKMIPVSQTFVLGLIIATLVAEIYKAAASYALTKRKNEVTIDNVNFTKFIETALPATYFILCILWGMLYKCPDRTGILLHFKNSCCATFESLTCKQE